MSGRSLTLGAVVAALLFIVWFAVQAATPRIPTTTVVRVYNETPTISGSNLVLANAPNPANSLRLHVNGVRQKPVEDYTISGATVTPAAANVGYYSDPANILVADYDR